MMINIGVKQLKALDIILILIFALPPGVTSISKSIVLFSIDFLHTTLWHFIRRIYRIYYTIRNDLHIRIQRKKRILRWNNRLTI
jgi:hypothetical protein